MIYIFVSILRIRKLAAYFLSLDPKTVAAWIKKSRYEQRKSCKKTSILDPYKLDIRREFEISQHSAQSIFKSLKNQGFTGGYTIVKNYIAILKRNLNTSGELNCSKDLLPFAWMLKLLQGKIDAISLVNEHAVNISLEDAETLITKIREGNLRERNRAIIVISKLKGIHNSVVSNFLMLNIRTVKGVIQKYASLGISKLFIIREGTIRKHEQNKYKDALFSILHAPPSDYDINRTSWTMEDLHRIMKNQGLSINKGSIRKIIKAAGFRFRKAIKVLTSTDPEYREKLIAITKILSNLTERECFFSIDEYGPFAIKMKGGLALSDPQIPRVVPQWQKSKGSLILTGALELSSNQFTHFYSEKKNTKEMIKLLHVLLEKYKNKKRLFFSWDAASWHASKELEKEVKRINADEYMKENNTPLVELAPLPACAQFLNVIESIFSGMARAIIHNSNYQSVDECESAIDRYFSERNEYFIQHPKRAGNKIWGKERVNVVFNESNNCKDPNYR